LGVTEDLVGKALRGLKALQVSGFTRLDGGLAVGGSVAVQGDSKLNGNLGLSQGQYAADGFQIPRVIAQIITGKTPGFGSGVAPSFLNLPQNFVDLEISYSVRDTSAGTGLAFLSMTINGNNAGVYFYALAEIVGTSVQSTGTQASTSGVCGLVVNGSASAVSLSSGFIEFPDYNQVLSGGMNWLYRSQATWAGGAAQTRQDVGGGLYNASGPITSIVLNVSPAVGSIFTLRGK
jgi:hypothetical protein